MVKATEQPLSVAPQVWRAHVIHDRVDAFTKAKRKVGSHAEPVVGDRVAAVVRRYRAPDKVAGKRDVSEQERGDHLYVKLLLLLLLF